MFFSSPPDTIAFPRSDSQDTSHFGFFDKYSCNQENINVVINKIYELFNVNILYEKFPNYYIMYNNDNNFVFD